MNRGTLWRMALETFFLQSSFAPERRQGVGVASVLSWMRDDLGEPLPAERLVRHAEGFNTNPALAGPLIGALARLESDLVPGDSVGTARIDKFKRGCEPTFAAAGDALLWRGLRGGGGTAGAALASAAGVWGPLVFLAVYNAGHLGFRLGGLFWGYRAGERTVGLLRSQRFRRLGVAARWLARLSPFLVIVAAAANTSESGPLALAAAAAVVGYFAARGTTSGGLVLWGAIIAGLIAARWWG